MGKFEINTQEDHYTDWFNLLKYIYLQYLHLFSIIRNKKLELAINKKHKAEIWKEYFIKLLSTEEQNN
jgi:hypothetical protein